MNFMKINGNSPDKSNGTQSTPMEAVNLKLLSAEDILADVLDLMSQWLFAFLHRLVIRNYLGHLNDTSTLKPNILCSISYSTGSKLQYNQEVRHSTIIQEVRYSTVIPEFTWILKLLEHRIQIETSIVYVNNQEQSGSSS